MILLKVRFITSIFGKEATKLTFIRRIAPWERSKSLKDGNVAVVFADVTSDVSGLAERSSTRSETKPSK